MEVENKDNSSYETCKFFIQYGICTLGNKCNKYHDRKEFHKQLIKHSKSKKRDDDNYDEKKEEKDDEKDESDIVEICFSFDTTGSMYQWLEEVKKKLKEIVNALFEKIPNIRISFIAHGDYCDEYESYLIKWINFSTV